MFIVGFVNKDKGFNGKILIFERKNEENKNRSSVRKDRNTGFETSAKLLLQFVFLKSFLYLYRMKQKLSSPSFADLFLGQRKIKQTFFSQINTVIDWAPIRAIIEVAYTKGYKSTGRPSYDSLVLFKINYSVLGMV